MTLDSLSVRTSPGGEVISHSGHSRGRQGVDRRVAEIADIHSINAKCALALAREACITVGSGNSGLARRLCRSLPDGQGSADGRFYHGFVLAPAERHVSPIAPKY